MGLVPEDAVAVPAVLSESGAGEGDGSWQAQTLFNTMAYSRVSFFLSPFSSRVTLVTFRGCRSLDF